VTDAAAWALVHFLWQGAALALLSWLLMRLAPGASVRYVIGVTTMAAMVVILGLTFAALLPDGTTGHVSSAPLAPEPSSRELISAAGTVVPPLPTSAYTASPFVLPTTWVLSLWATGVCLLSLRVLGGWVITRRVARDALSPRAPALEHLASGVQARLGIRRLVRVVESSRVAVPVMIGWIRPVVLIPPAAIAGLSPAQMEAILAHEFAHVRRHDYLINLLQTGVETLLFFHPAVWWLSLEIRRERELCCDDLAVGVCDRLTYATALSALAHLQPPSLALAATDGSLRDRIRRIVTTSSSSESAKGGWMAMLPLLVVVSLAAPSAFMQTASRPEQVSVAEVVEAPVTSSQAASIKVASPPAVVERPVSVQVPPARPQAQPAPNSVREQLLDEQLAIERRKLALDKARLENDTALELLRLEMEAENSAFSLAETRKKAAAGTVMEGTLRSWENSHQMLISRLESQKRTLALRMEEIGIREQELTLQRRMQSVGLSVSAPRPPAAIAASDVIRAGDALSIRVAGEDQLPREFTVAADGSIRFPFLGPVKVEGSTIAQFQTTLVKLLTDRHLVEKPAVTVTATRR
jgi:beta-lactamase regulating signal transducer with metallopeptidase domain